MQFEIPYGSGAVEVVLPQGAEVVRLPEPPITENARAEIRRAMDEPIGSPALHQLARERSDVAIVINDLTRPAPSALMLEEILVDLNAAGIREDRVTVVVACGNHRPNTPAEIREMVGAELASRLRIVNHDSQDGDQLTYLGETEGGLPVWVHSAVASASLVIVTGVIAPHHGAGFSGGRKSAVTGVAGLETIKRLHSFPILPYGPAIGWLEGNPMHEAAVAGARLLGVDFCLNVVETPLGAVFRAVAGDVERAHEAGVRVCEDTWRIELSRQFDVVIVSPGGYPRDINLHQSQKAMSAAELVVKEGGIIVLIAECADGIGKFAPWLLEAGTPQEVIERFKSEGFTGGQSFKAFYCARALAEHPVHVASRIESGDLERMFFQPAPSPQTAIDEAMRLAGPGASVLVLPHAVHCIPKVVSDGR